MDEERTPEFLYDALNKHFDSTKKFLDCGGYMAMIMPENPDFIGFSKKGKLSKEVSADGKIFKEYGLKFHISLPEYDRGMFKAAWKVVKDTLIYHQVAVFKVIRAAYKMSDKEGQEGKDVTIYSDAEPNKTAEQWKVVLQDVTNNLLAAGITPGYRALGTRQKPEEPIEGSNYITYRYYNEETKQSIWPAVDPCKKIKVVSQSTQPDIPALNRQKPQGNMEKSANAM